MNATNDALKKQALDTLSGNWGLAIGVFLVYLLISGGCSFIPFSSVIVSGPLALGLAIFSLSLSRTGSGEVAQLFQGFNNFGNALATYLLMTIFILLWMLLLIVPGIIAAISYSQAIYILADDPSIGPMEAIDKSKKMMEGHKMRFFVLALSFLGWFLLSILTLGIGLLWLMPYAQITFVKFYDDLKGTSAENMTSAGDPTVLDTY